MRDEKKFIYECAARGLSRCRTAELVGVWPAAFREYLELIGLGDIEFVNGYKSISANEGRRRSGQSRKGVPQTYLTDADRANLRQRMLDLAPKHTAFGVTATLGELVNQFATVSKETVRLRLKRGINIEDALKLPRDDFVVRARKNPETHPWRACARMGFENHRAKQLAN